MTLVLRSGESSRQASAAMTMWPAALQAAAPGQKAKVARRVQSSVGNSFMLSVFKALERAGLGEMERAKGFEPNPNQRQFFEKLAKLRMEKMIRR